MESDLAGRRILRLKNLYKTCMAMHADSADLSILETLHALEPLHFYIYGYGMQSPHFCAEKASGSWAFVWLHSLPASVLAWIFPEKKIWAFYFFRMLLAALCAHVETVYAQSVLRRHGWWQWALLTFCLACDPFLHEFSPEAFGGLMIMWSHANLLKKRHGSALLFLALSVFVSASPPVMLVALPLVRSVQGEPRSSMGFLSSSQSFF